MNRVDFFFEQIVTEGDLDEAFDYVEQAQLDHRVDTGLLGIVSGMTVAAQAVPNLTVNVLAGSAYDNDGNRILIGGTQVVNLAGAQPAGVGASRIVSVCVRFDRTLSDPRVDGNSVTIQYQRAESYEIFLVSGSEVVGSPVAPAKPADGLVLADVRLNQGDTAVVTGDIDMTTTGRRDWAFDIAVGSLPTLQVGTLTEVVTSNRQVLSDHITDLTFPHAASSISFTDPGSGSAATNVQSILTAILDGTVELNLTNSGGYSFDSDVTFESGSSTTLDSEVTITGPLEVNGTAAFDNDVEFATNVDFAGVAEFASPATFSSNVTLNSVFNFNGSSFSYRTSANHAFSDADETLQNLTIQQVGTTTNSYTIASVLSGSSGSSRSGLIEVTAFWWTDNTSDTFAAQKWLVGYDKASGTSTPAIGTQAVLGSLVQGTAAPSIIMSIDAASNAIRLRALFNANLTVNFFVTWRHMVANRNE